MIRFYALVVAVCSVTVCSIASAQQRAPAPPDAATPAPTDSKPGATQEQLEQLLAPIALYPDSLVSQILMASTYPLEIVESDRWVKANPNVKGDALAAALNGQDWDASVKSLTGFPDVLSMMSEKLDWTTKLGDAFIDQQKQVLDTIQSLRRKAKGEGNLNSTEQQKVTETSDSGTQVIVIESSSPDVIYVPTYDPVVVYGAWPYPAYPPYSYYPPGYVAGTALLSFGVGMACGAAWGYAWGNCNWHGGDIDIDVDHNYNFNKNIDRNKAKNELKNKGLGNGTGKGNWQHDASHRRGVAYRDNSTAQRYGRGSDARAAQARDQYRGRQGSGGNGQLGGAGQRGAGDRAGAGAGAGDRGSAFGDGGRNGGSTRDASNRGNQSRGSSGGGSRGGGSRGGGSRGGGGRGRGGGGRGR